MCAVGARLFPILKVVSVCGRCTSFPYLEGRECVCGRCTYFPYLEGRECVCAVARPAVPKLLRLLGLIGVQAKRNAFRGTQLLRNIAALFRICGATCGRCGSDAFAQF
jgi:hypothetical protein